MQDTFPMEQRRSNSASIQITKISVQHEFKGLVRPCICHQLILLFISLYALFAHHLYLYLGTKSRLISFLLCLNEDVCKITKNCTESILVYSNSWSSKSNKIISNYAQRVIKRANFTIYYLVSVGNKIIHRDTLYQVFKGLHSNREAARGKRRESCILNVNNASSSKLPSDTDHWPTTQLVD